MAAVTHIFEDAYEPRGRRSPVKDASSKQHKRTGSVGAILRGRRLKENDPSQTEPVKDPRRSPERPLGERHINSPPNTYRVPLKGDNERPKMHKKTRSAVSLKSLISGKGADSSSISSTDGPCEDRSPTKSQSSRGFGALLKKKSAKTLKQDAAKSREEKENAGPVAPLENTRSPIWEQFATQSSEKQIEKAPSPERRERTIAEEINLYAPKGLSGNGELQNGGPAGYAPPDLTEAPPRPPFLQHKSSRSSIFTEEGVDADYPVSPHYKVDQERPKSGYFESPRPSTGSRSNTTDSSQDVNPKRSSRVMEAFNALTSWSKDTSQQHTPEQKAPLSPQEIDAAFENVLDSRNIPHNMREKMRSMDMKIKADFIKSHRVESGSSTASASNEELRPSSRSPVKSQSPRKGEKDQLESKRSRSRPRGRAFTLSRSDNSAPKKQKSGDDSRARSRSRPRSIEIIRPGSSRSMTSTTSYASIASPMGRADCPVAPGDFIHYLREVQKPEIVEIGKVHKLRILLRNESVAWTDSFIAEGGMDEIVSLLYRIIKVEWREEHEDTLLHEVLLCLKGLCTTSLALARLTTIADTLFPTLLAMLFDPERKGPAEFSTRSTITSLLFMHLSSATSLPQPEMTARARKILEYLADPAPEEAKQPLDFISQMHVRRPYRIWCKEIVNVTKEVFWIFLHHLNVIPSDTKASSNSSSSSTSYLALHFPTPPPPHPAAPYVGGVEWEATLYLATHMDLVNGLIATLPTPDSRNILRQEMRDSGFEKVMGATLRTCKEKFYGHLHLGLRFWVTAAMDDGWDVTDVKEGPPREVRVPSPKKPVGKPPVVALPKLDVKIDGEDKGGLSAAAAAEKTRGDDLGWL